MKRIVIWGTGELGRCTEELLDKATNNVIAFIDNNKKVQGNKIRNIPILSLEKLLSKETNIEEIVVLVTALNSKNIYEILEQLSQAKFKNIGLVKSSVLLSARNIKLDEDEESGEIIWSRKDGKKYFVVPRIELNVIDNCNLNCLGCTHFSSLYEKDSIYPLEQYNSDLKQLRLLGKMLRLRLLGGEPFLVQELDEYIVRARNVFPEANIEIVTNGLLIPKVSKKVLKSIKDNNLSVIISLYPPTKKMAKQIQEVLDSYDIMWRFDGEEITEFSRNITLKKEADGLAASKVCLSSGCTFLRNGELFKCPAEALLPDMLKYYNVDMDLPINAIDIYDEIDTVRHKLVEKAIRPVKLCKMCSEELELIPWQVKRNPEFDDWLYHTK